MAAMGQNGATMFQCGTFSGKGEEPATRWPRKLEWEMKRKCSDGKDIDPADLLQTVDFLVFGEPPPGRRARPLGNCWTVQPYG